MKKILFVIHELEYTGSPRSTLRMCKVALNLGYEVSVWSMKEGPFIEEFNSRNIEVQIVDHAVIHKKEWVKLIKTYDMAICNTIITDVYVRILCRYIPTVWYIREAGNISKHVKGNPRRRYMLRYFNNICSVSVYAAKEIRKYTKNKVQIIHNCVEDESDKASDYVVGTNDKVRFTQFGTLIDRKGYDVLFDAFESLPAAYQDKAELFFAGSYSDNSYAESILQRAENNSHICYLGVLKGDDKTKRLSEMDVVIVASRDESCSLVVLEGAMLSKPLIVTENVGAKYMVKTDNGCIVKTDDSESLMLALKYMIDNKDKLEEMGKKSRRYYDKKANMKIYTKEMKELFKECDKKTTLSFGVKCLLNRFWTSNRLIEFMSKHGKV